MFERFTPRARRVIVLAQDAARSMGHARITPDHLLVALQQGEGVASTAMTRAGVNGEALRQRVTALHDRTEKATKVDKVPFSPAAKQCLEQSLRAAVGLGHSYIGTEHLFFGVERQAEASDRSLDGLLGVAPAEVHRRVMEVLGGPGPVMRSPALQAALERARAEAGESRMTTGQLLVAMVADPDSQVARALVGLGIDQESVKAALDGVPLDATSDASPAPQSVALTIGETTTVIADADVAVALQRLSAAELREAIRRAAADPGTDGTETEPPAG